MDPTTLEFFAPFIGLTILCATGLTAYWLRLRAKHSADPGAEERLRAELDEVRASLESLRDALGGRMAELEERADFAERLLTQGRAAPPVPQEPSTPV